MSDLQDLIARSSTISYQQGRKDERLTILSLARDASVENNTGRYVYLSDLEDYIEEWDRGQDEKRNQKTD